MLAEFITALQALVVATVLPQVARSLHGYAFYGYAFSGYLIAQFIMTPVAGAWVDRFGVRRILLVSYPMVALGLAFSGSATSMGMFIGARVLEGAAGGMDAVVAFSAVAKLFPEGQRSRMFALFSTMWAVPAVAGPVAGAFIAQTLGWRWAFYLFIPLIAVSAALVVPNVQHTPTSESRAIDAVKMLFSRGVLIAERGIPAGIAAFFFLFAAFFGADGFVPLYLTHERQQPLIIGGLSVMLSALAWSGASVAVPRLRAQFAPSTIVSIGALCLIAGSAGLVCTTLISLSIAAIFACWTIGGVGIGLAYNTILSEVFERAEGGREGALASVALMSALLGMVFGTGLGGLALTVAQHWGYSIASGLTGAFGVSFICAIALLSIANRQTVSEAVQ